MRILACFFCVLLTIIPGNSQSFKGLLVDDPVYNFGTVTGWDNPPAIFFFENTSFDPFYILAPKSSRKVLVEYPRNKIESGEKGEIRVYYYTDKAGSFSEEVLLYSSNSDKPIKLNVKGQIKEFADNALTKCPEFGSDGKIKKKEYIIEGLVIDKITKKPISNSLVRFAGIETIYTDRKGEFKQKIPVGLYISLAQAEGYRDLNMMVGVQKNMDKIIYELMPLDSIPDVVDTIPVVIDTARVDTETVEIDTIPVLTDENPEFTYREYRANNLVFLVDISGSMKRSGKIDSLKTAMLYMAGVLRSVDKISLITFATKTNEVFRDVSGDQKDLILPTIEGLIAKGTTNGVLGLEKAFEIALDQYIDGGNNQVIVITDGMFNGTNSNPGAVIELIEAYNARGIILSVVGFGKNKTAISQMTKMANIGQGSFIQFENGESAKPKLIEEIKSRSKR